MKVKVLTIIFLLVTSAAGGKGRIQSVKQSPAFQELFFLIKSDIDAGGSGLLGFDFSESFFGF